jgi:hypothetical protein
VFFDNTKNILVEKTTIMSVIRRFGHPFLLWEISLSTYIIESFDYSNSCYLIMIELGQLHRRFEHSSAERLYRILERSRHDDDSKWLQTALNKLIKFCKFCQMHDKSPDRFKFKLRDDLEFNYCIVVNIMYVENSLILHVIDEVTRYQVVRWLKNITAKHTWKTLRLCWIDVYLSLLEYIQHDAEKNFVSTEFRQQRISSACYHYENYHEIRSRWSSLINRNSETLSCCIETRVRDNHDWRTQSEQSIRPANDDESD